ncbi:isochorismatase family protein [Microvirga pudoricolor]|uniref:isochorismatase family protein n=1 Tax=Microvirga pudoricolor TaxID=2778729 RepID=UPI00194F37BB|nr:isochorismatase family protein [Microvirga pudoricolor]MBM6592417.1 isochorismatase family protein [Microvirga pudoricolor]
MLLDAARSQLLVVDLQERLLPAIAESDRVLRNVDLLLKGAARLALPVTVTEQYPKGLGTSVASVMEAVPSEAAILPKLAFSAEKDPAIRERVIGLSREGRDQLVVCGTEAHVCVLQSALGFHEAGLGVFVVGDAVSSRSPHSVSAACARLLHAGCHWVTAEMALFEWMERAATEDFRALAPLLK